MRDDRHAEVEDARLLGDAARRLDFTQVGARGELKAVAGFDGGPLRVRRIDEVEPCRRGDAARIGGKHWGTFFGILNGSSRMFVPRRGTSRAFSDALKALEGLSPRSGAGTTVAPPRGQTVEHVGAHL